MGFAFPCQSKRCHLSGGETKSLLFNKKACNCSKNRDMLRWILGFSCDQKKRPPISKGDNYSSVNQSIYVDLLTPWHEQDVIQGQFFKQNLNSKFFFFLDQLLYQGWRAQPALLFTHSWRENNWIHTLLKVISAKWNANSLIQV